MKRIFIYIAFSLFSLTSVVAGVSWSSNIPTNICFGDETWYTITADCSGDIGQFKDSKVSIQKYNTTTKAWDYLNGTIVGVVSGSDPTSGTSNKANFKLMVDEHLGVGSYKIHATAYKGVTKTPHTRIYQFNIYDAAVGYNIETDVLSYDYTGKLRVCPGETAYRFYIDGIENTNLKWTVDEEGATVEEPDVYAAEKNIIFSSTDGTPYRIKVNDVTGCKVEKVLEVVPRTQVTITGELQVRGGTLCKDGIENVIEIPQQAWATSYTWNISNGSGLVNITPNSNRCYVSVLDHANNDDRFIISVVVSDGCTSRDKTQEIDIVDITAQADYIEALTQETIPLPICHNSTNIPINGPVSTSNSPIVSWEWYDGSTSKNLNKTFFNDQDIYVRVTDNRGCQKTYSFLADVQEPPVIDLPWHHVCAEQEILVDLSTEFSGYDIGWNDGSESKIRSFPNNNTSFDEPIFVQYHELGGNNCINEYTQHFELNPIPEFQVEPDLTCLGSSITLFGPSGGYDCDWQNVTSNTNSREIFYTIQELNSVNQVMLTATKNGCDFEKLYTLGIKDNVELIIEGGNSQDICYGSDVLLNIPNGFTNITWHNNGSNASNQLLQNVTTNQSILVSAEINGCYVEATINLNVLDLPNLSLETTKNAYCAGEEFEINLDGRVEGRQVTANDFKSIDWSHGVDYRMTNNVNLQTTTEISCYVVDQNNCQSAAHKTITINDNPTLNMQNQYVCEGKNTTIQPGSFTKYLWYNNSTSSSLTLNNVQAPVTNAWVKVTDDNDCSTLSEFEIQMFDVNNIYIEPIDICLGETKTLTAPSGFTNYAWSTGETTRSIEVSPTSDFTYTCEVSDPNCEQILEYEVIVSNSTPFTMDNIYACNGQNTTAIGPTGYDKYAWNYEAAATKDLIFKANTDFTLSLTAWQNGCPHTASAQVVVVEAESFNFTDKAICNGSSISYTAPAGYTYDWSDNSQDGKQTGTFSPNTTSSYSLTIEDTYGCTSSDEFVVTVNDFIDFNIPDKDICRGTTTEIGVNPIYTSYLWTTGETTANISVSPLSSTPYSVTVTDFNGCQGTATSNVTVLDNLAITLENKTVCSGEFVTIGLDNNKEFHSYAWNNGSNQSQQDVAPSQTTPYTLTVTDENGCSASASMQVTVFNPQTITLDPVTVCEGQPATITAPNSLTEHTWNGNVTGLDAYTINNMKYNSVVNLRARDVNGCLTYASTNVLVNRNPVINIADKNMCKFESAQLHLPENFVSYAWSNGSTESYTNILAQENTAMDVTVTDINGCSVTEAFNIIVYEYTPISLTNQSICKGEAVTVTLNGTWTGQTWSNGKTSQQITEYPVRNTDFTVHATDLNGCKSIGSMTVAVNTPATYELPNIEICSGETKVVTADPGFAGYLWHTGETTQSITINPLSNELVTVAVTDNNGCVTTAKKLAVVYPNPEIYLDNYDVCIGNDVDIVAPGGYTYLWDNGSTSRINTVGPVANTDYILTVTDGYGCRATATSSVTVRQRPNLSLISYTVCPGEIINIDGGADYNKYNWSNGVIGRYNTVKPTVNMDYNLTVEDVYGCVATATSSVIVHNVNELSLNNISVCKGDTTELLAQNGFLSYEWTTGNTGRNLRGVLSNYDKIGLTVTDGNGCTQYQEKTVSVLDKPEFFLADQYVACEGQSVNVNITPGYLRYNWSDGSYLNNRTFWPNGTMNLSLEVEHLNGCKLKKETTIREATFVTNYLQDQLACHNEVTEFNLLNSEALTNISWSTGETGNTKIYVQADKDSVISASFSDIYGCEGEASAQLFLQSSVSPKLQDITICKGEMRNIFASGVYSSYLWSTGETTPYITIVGDVNRTITLEVQDQYGCRYTSSLLVTVKDMPDINLPDLNLCYTDTISIGVPQFENCEYLWNTGETTNIISKFIDSDKQFILSVTDEENGCTITDTAKISVYPKPSLDLDNHFADKGDIIILTVDESFNNVAWSNGETTKTITVTADTTEHLYVEAIDNNGCKVKEEVFIYVTGPEEHMVISDTVCSGDPCVIAARSGYKSYKWNTGETNRYIIRNDNIETDYSVEITDHGGKTNTFSTRSKIKPGPQISIGDTTICYGNDLTLRIPAGAVFYRWSNGVETNEVTFSNVESPFEYSIFVEGINGCTGQKGGLVTLHQDVYNIKGLKEKYGKGEEINISISNDDKVSSCKFYIDGVEFDGTTVSTKIYDAGEVEIRVQVQDINGCYFEKITTTSIEGSNSITDNDNDNWLFIYPNPVRDRLTIELGNSRKGYNIIIYNSNGEQVVNNESNTDKYELNTEELPEGMYILHVITDGNTYTKKIIKK